MLASVISPANTFDVFWWYWPTSGIKYLIFKTQNEMHMYIEFLTLRSTASCELEIPDVCLYNDTFSATRGRIIDYECEGGCE